MRHLLHLLAPIFIAAGSNSLAADPPTPKGFDVASRPNIIFVLFDDMGYGQPPSYRAASGFLTPGLDRMAREGMRFTDAHSAAASCTPTRYGVITGRYPSRIGQFSVLSTFSPPIIPKDRPTVASFLKAQGYHTACIGKWHLGMTWVDRDKKQKELPMGARMTGGPNALGFDYFYGFTHARNIGSIIEQDRIVDEVTAVENQPLMIAKALEYIGDRADSDQPFFLYFPMCPPHKPIVPAPEFIGKGGSEGRYGDWVHQGDHMLGQILDALKKHSLAENTLVIATADNGAAKREYEPHRAHKGSIYEGGHREPFVVRWPGKITAGSTYDHTVCLNDFFATCADLLDVPLPVDAAEDSVSLLPCLLGKTSDPVREATVHQSGKGLAIRQGPWKMIFHRDGKRELFNLSDDISETKDLFTTNKETSTHLTGLMQSYIDRGRSTAGPPRKNEYDLVLWDGKTENKKTGKRKKRKANKASKQVEK